MDRAKVQRLYDEGLTLREIAARLNAEGCSTAQGRQWTENVVWHWLGKRGRRQELECAQAALTEYYGLLYYIARGWI